MCTFFTCEERTSHNICEEQMSHNLYVKSGRVIIYVRREDRATTFHLGVDYRVFKDDESETEAKTNGRLPGVCCSLEVHFRKSGTRNKSTLGMLSKFTNTDARAHTLSHETVGSRSRLIVGRGKDL